jgi:uncharacterized Zn finger protein (UPF0148 family)
MKYCPYCGAEVNDGAVSFCSECGKPFQGQEEATTKTHEKKGASGKSTKKKARKEKPAKQVKVKKEKPKKKSKDIPEIIGEPVDDGYDGYYNDVLPPDTDRVKDGMDKELVKKIVALCIGVSVIILMCVALLYVL